MILVGSPNAQFVFTGTGGHNALYIDYLELDGFTATNSNPSGDFTGIDVSPNMVVYFAQAMADGVSIAEKLNGRNQGRLCWVSNYNFGYFSSTEVTYPDGTSNRLNAALVASCDLVSNTTNQPPVVNCNNTTAPIWPIPAPPASTNNVPLLAAVSVPPLSQTVLAGSAVTFSVVASSPAPLSYQWRKNGVAIPGALSAAYTIDNAQPSDAGAYSVAIANFAGYIVSPEATLTVMMAPSILEAPHNLTVAPGGTASFTVSASGSPPLAYQWRFNDADIAGATDSAYSRGNVQAADAGVYKVVVSNPFGSITTLGAALTVGSTNNPGAGLALAPPSASLSTQDPSSNAFALAVGTYNGLFSDTNGAAPASSGSFSAKVTRGGAYTATLTLGARSYRASGAFNAQTRSATASLSRGALLPPLALALRLDFGGGGQMLGTVSSGNQWSAALQAYRPVPAQAGSYTAHIPHSGVSLGAAPAGDGYGILKVDAAGNVRFSGALADGSKVSQNATLSKDGYWGLYASLYGGSGCIVSWVQFNAASPGGELVWLKPPVPGAKSYPAGFTNVVSAALWPYTPASSMAGFSGGALLCTGGGLANPLTNTFSFDAHGRVVRPAGSKLSLSFTPSSGLFSGSTRSPGLTQTLAFQGVLCQPGTNGYGYFLGPQQSGQVYLDLAR